MPNSTPWLIPILLLPGVALLVMSTAVRFGQIHDELHHMLEIDEAVTLVFWQHLSRRTMLFRNALVSLYLSIGAFVMGSLVGALLDMAGRSSTWAVTTFAFTGRGEPDTHDRGEGGHRQSWSEVLRVASGHRRRTIHGAVKATGPARNFECE